MLFKYPINILRPRYQTQTIILIKKLDEGLSLHSVIMTENNENKKWWIVQTLDGNLIFFAVTVSTML